MTLRAIIRHKHARAAFSGIVAALLGWQFCWLPLGQFLSHLSYDLPFVFSAPSAPGKVVLVEMDETSHTELRQAYGATWDRGLHARLLDYLRADGADVVVFDIVFTEPGPDAATDREFARAIRAHGRVVLAADVDNTRRNGIVGDRILPPTEGLRDATADWGPTQAEKEDDDVVRRIYPGTEQRPSLDWAAASLAKGTSITTKSNRGADQFIRYYGPGGTLARVSYSQATNQPAGFYRGKTVFIGGRPKTGLVGEEVDEFFTPWRLDGQPQISGLELTATEFLNLSRGEFLQRLPVAAEFSLLVLWGILAGAGLACLRPRLAILSAVSACLAIVGFAFLLFFQGHWWFNWTVAVLVEIPCALAWSLGWHWWQLKKEKDWLEAPLPDLWAGPAADEPAPAPSPSAAPAIPDHEMLRQVGRGAYGDVWLARDVLGSFHAVKIVRRIAFDHAAPYEREFRGLQKFTPISRAHPGLVNILHAGRDPAADYFYYIMEAGDDQTGGAAIDPATYSPRNLGREIQRRAPLPPRECVDIISELCDALEFLHANGLLHRDIKPANIIFVNGRPKLADVGLVTDLSESRAAHSSVGTEGYLPPEGPGTRAGDIFALGKVLAEMLRLQSGPDAGPVAPELRPFHLIISQACAADPSRRFASAQAMREALRKLAA